MRRQAPEGYIWKDIGHSVTVLCRISDNKLMGHVMMAILHGEALYSPRRDHTSSAGESTWVDDVHEAYEWVEERLP